MKNELLWKPTPKRVENTSLFKFIKHVNAKHKEKIDSFEALHKWSVENRSYFWDEVWNFYNVIGEKGNDPYLEPENCLPGTKFFPNGTLNYAENMLSGDTSGPAIVFKSEDKIRKEILETVPNFSEINELPKKSLIKTNNIETSFFSEKIFVRELDYYYTNSISRSSKTMSECRQIRQKIKKDGTNN